MTEYVVLDEYTNDSIATKVAGRSDPAAQAWRELATFVPPDWRQSIMAAAHADAYVARYTMRSDTGLTEPQLMPTGTRIYDAIRQRVVMFQVGWRPVRTETPRLTPQRKDDLP